MINVPVLLSNIYEEAYYEVLVALGEVAPGPMTAIWHWFKNTHMLGEVKAHKVACD